MRPQPDIASISGRVRVRVPATIMLAARTAVAAALAAVLIALGAQAARAAEFGVKKWEAGTCTSSACTDGTPESFYTQAAGHPPYGITDFRFNSETSLGLLEVPVGHVKDVRVDLPSGLAVDPEAVPACSQAQIEASACPPESKVGEDEAVGAAGGIAIKESFPVYEMERKQGQSALFGVEVKSAALTLLKLESIIYLEGGLSWYHEAEAPGGESSGVATGDYHELFKIRNIPKEPELIESRLVFWGVPFEKNGGLPGTDRALITMPSACNGPQVTWLHVDSYEDEGHFLAYENRTPVGASGCESLAYEPAIKQHPETTQSDAPDGTEVRIHVPQATEAPAKANSPDLLEAKVTLPEGMTLNPSAANGLEACADDLFKLGTNERIECPAKSIVGTVSVDAPGIPNGSLQGSVYLGTPKSSEPGSGQEYRIFVAAEAPAYGVGVRLEGRVSADPSTGRLITTFSDLPPVPFEDFALKFKGGATAPLGNPLTCGSALTSAIFSPYSGEPAATPVGAFNVDFDGMGGACPAPLPFSVGQSTQASSTTAGSRTSFTLTLTRAQGQQYISALSTTLPAGMIGEIPAVPRCSQADAAAAKCPADTRIGTASVAVGSGSAPFAMPPGPVYLTGPYEGAPFGLAIVTNAEKVGPFDYGLITTRAKIEIDPYTARVTVASSLPTVVGGAPIRLRSISVAIDHPGFMLDPTSCAPLATDTTLTSTFGATGSVSTPFQATGCGALGFTPSLSAATSARATRRFGASLNVSVSERPQQSNIRSVAVMLPKKLVARLAALKGACPAETFAANPYACPVVSRVGGVSVSTPALPGMLRGPADLVSHGGAAFPDLDLVLKGDGVTIILVGKTNIKGVYTHSHFASLPDVPIDSFALKLPTGPHSALSANGNLCRGRLYMPTTIVAENGKRLTQRTRIRVAGCKRHAGRHGKSIVRHRRNHRKQRGR